MGYLDGKPKRRAAAEAPAAASPDAASGSAEEQPKTPRRQSVNRRSVAGRRRSIADSIKAKFFNPSDDLLSVSADEAAAAEEESDDDDPALGQIRTERGRSNSSEDRANRWGKPDPGGRTSKKKRMNRGSVRSSVTRLMGRRFSIEGLSAGQDRGSVGKSQKWVVMDVATRLHPVSWGRFTGRTSIPAQVAPHSLTQTHTQYTSNNLNFAAAENHLDNVDKQIEDSLAEAQEAMKLAQSVTADLKETLAEKKETAENK